MKVVDLHPEDLLEKDALGQLDEGERARLDAHIEHCVTCRFERQLRADFVDELRADVPPPKFVGLGANDASPPSSSPRRQSVWPRRRTRTTWLFAAAALLVGSVAAATGVNRSWMQPIVAPAATTAPATPEATAARKPARLAHRAPPLEPMEAPLAVEENAAPVNPTPAAVEAPASPKPPVGVGPVDVARAGAVEGPTDLFDAASDARRRGDYSRVLELYRKLEARYPQSREAQVSRATVGRLMLDRGDPSGALSSFGTYLAAGSGELGEEAMVGRAIALERLGRGDEASRAWRALLAAFPETPYAAHAKARLGY